MVKFKIKKGLSMSSPSSIPDRSSSPLNPSGLSPDSPSSSPPSSSSPPLSTSISSDSSPPSTASTKKLAPLFQFLHSANELDHDVRKTSHEMSELSNRIKKHEKMLHKASKNVERHSKQDIGISKTKDLYQLSVDRNRVVTLPDSIAKEKESQKEKAVLLRVYTAKEEAFLNSSFEKVEQVINELVETKDSLTEEDFGTVFRLESEMRKLLETKNSSQKEKYQGLYDTKIKSLLNEVKTRLKRRSPTPTQAASSGRALSQGISGLKSLHDRHQSQVKKNVKSSQDVFLLPNQRVVLKSLAKRGQKEEADIQALMNFLLPGAIVGSFTFKETSLSRFGIEMRQPERERMFPLETLPLSSQRKLLDRLSSEDQLILADIRKNPSISDPLYGKKIEKQIWSVKFPNSDNEVELSLKELRGLYLKNKLSIDTIIKRADEEDTEAKPLLDHLVSNSKFYKSLTFKEDKTPIFITPVLDDLSVKKAFKRCEECKWSYVDEKNVKHEVDFMELMVRGATSSIKDVKQVRVPGKKEIADEEILKARSCKFKIVTPELRAIKITTQPASQVDLFIDEPEEHIDVDLDADVDLDSLLTPTLRANESPSDEDSSDESLSNKPTTSTTATSKASSQADSEGSITSSSELLESGLDLSFMGMEFYPDKPTTTQENPKTASPVFPEEQEAITSVPISPSSPPLTPVSQTSSNQSTTPTILPDISEGERFYATSLGKVQTKPFIEDMTLLAKYHNQPEAMNKALKKLTPESEAIAVMTSVLQLLDLHSNNIGLRPVENEEYKKLKNKNFELVDTKTKVTLQEMTVLENTGKLTGNQLLSYEENGQKIQKKLKDIPELVKALDVKYELVVFDTDVSLGESNELQVQTRSGRTERLIPLRSVFLESDWKDEPLKPEALKVIQDGLNRGDSMFDWVNKKDSPLLQRLSTNTTKIIKKKLKPIIAEFNISEFRKKDSRFTNDDLVKKFAEEISDVEKNKEIWERMQFDLSLKSVPILEGDTIETIAERYNQDPVSFAEFNKDVEIAPPNKIKIRLKPEEQIDLTSDKPEARKLRLKFAKEFFPRISPAQSSALVDRMGALNEYLEGREALLTSTLESEKLLDQIDAFMKTCRSLFTQTELDKQLEELNELRNDLVFEGEEVTKVEIAAKRKEICDRTIPTFFNICKCMYPLLADSFELNQILHGSNDAGKAVGLYHYPIDDSIREGIQKESTKELAENLAQKIEMVEKPSFFGNWG